MNFKSLNNKSIIIYIYIKHLRQKSYYNKDYLYTFFDLFINLIKILKRINHIFIKSNIIRIINLIRKEKHILFYL